MRRAITITAALAAIATEVLAGTAISEGLTSDPVAPLTPASGTTTIEATAPVPEGGPGWAVRAYIGPAVPRASRSAGSSARRSSTCDPTGVFMARGGEPSGTCDSTTSDEPIVAQNPAGGC